VAKYRPRVPVLLITDSMAAARAVAPLFGVYVSIVDELPRSRFDVSGRTCTTGALGCRC
jgi:hypothetical protein